MTVMSGPLILIAAIVSPTAAPTPPLAHAPSFHASASATARATASVRIVSGVSFGSGRPPKVSGAAMRVTRVNDAEALPRTAYLLEFQ
ncbi:MAG: hypothetical protein ABIP07_01280 [Sphingomicrobium sp.]